MENAEVTQRINFHQALLTSGLVDPEAYRSLLESLNTTDPQITSEALVKRGEITAYQAEQLHLGRTKFRLGPYLITEGIGQGGMGQVFKRGS